MTREVMATTAMAKNAEKSAGKIFVRCIIPALLHELGTLEVGSRKMDDNN
jgi:hypothetical protein